ncbi:DUF4199 domain-containing protein [Paraflavisolibacter sp. H34]|uniref:DUF4199 domain-containing protein n=1 Tax=Huijunlia imazamoxiresistens TaxID=3127457 RepID=UPI00301AE6C9
MQKETNVNFGLRWGVIIGLVYAALLFIRYSVGEANPMMFGMWTFVGYAVVLILLYICGVNRRKLQGGYIDLRDAFQTMFIAVLGFEFFYMAFNFIYLKFINPDFFQNMKEALEAFLIKNKVEQADIDKKLENFDSDMGRNMTLGTSFLSFAYAIVTSGIFALLFALLIRRKREPWEKGDVV